MYTRYRGRHHTQKQSSGKPKCSTDERRKRTLAKKFSRLFPCWQHHFQHPKDKPG